MKKILLGTTGLVVAAMVASPASAAEKITLGLGGYMEQWVGFVDQAAPYENTHNEFDQQSDSEIYFTGKTKLDNGITVGATVQLEADQGSGGEIDASFLYFSSEGMGTLQLGSVSAITDAAHHNAPDVGIGRGDANNWVRESNATPDADTAYFDDRNKIQYITPSFSGFQVGVFYTPALNAQPSGMELTTTDSAAGIVAAYNGDFDGVSVGADLGYVTTENDYESWQAGLSIGFNGFTVGGAYWNLEDLTYDGDAYDVGVSYASGPYAVSLSWYNAELDWINNTSDEHEVIMGSAQYTMGPGVKLRGSIFHQDSVVFDVDDGDGWGVVGGVRLDF